MEPSSMTVNDDRFKVVFLTDIRRWSSGESDSNIVRKCTASVRLSVLKLLTYFAHGSAGQPTHLRWGYKFFNSIDVPPCKREAFKEFVESNVETFEEQLLQEFEAGATVSKRSESLPKSEKTVKDTGESVRHTLSDVLQDFQWEGPDIRSPVKSLSVSASVSRRTRTQTRAVATESCQQNFSKSNFVFLFMPCPHYQSNLMEFFGITGKNKNKHKIFIDPTKLTSTNMPSCEQPGESVARFTAEEFKDYIAPPDGGLPEKLKQNGISIYWIDTAPLHAQNQKVPERDRYGLSIASQAMRQLGGAIIPITTLLTLNNQDLNLHLQSTLSLATRIGLPDDKHVSTKEANTNTEQDTPHETTDGGSQPRAICSNVARSFFPWSSVISHCVRKEHSCDGMGLCMPGEENLLYSCKDGQLIPHCKLKLKPLFGRQTSRFTSNAASSSSEVLKPHTLPSPSRTSSALHTSHKDTPCSINARTGDTRFLLTTSSGDTSKSNSTLVEGGLTSSAMPYGDVGNLQHENPDAKGLRKGTVINRGVLPTQSLFLDVHFEDVAYTCTGVALESSHAPVKVQTMDEDATCVDQILKLSTWFKKTMIGLSQKKMALLVEMLDVTSGVPITAVLEPLTAVTASFRVIKTNMIASVKRLIQTFRQSRNTKRPGAAERSAQDTGVVSDEVAAKIKDVAKRCVRQQVVSQRARKRSVSKASSPVMSSGLQCSARQAMSRFNPHYLESWYHKGPTQGVPVKFIEHLKDIPEDLGKQCGKKHPTLDQLLYDVEVMYDNQPMRVQSGMATTPVQKVQPKKTLNLAPRTISLMERSIKQAHNRKKLPDKKQMSASKSNRNTVDVYVEIVSKGKCRFTSEEELLSHLQASYNKVLTGKSDLMTYILKTIPVILMFANLKSTIKVDKGLNEEVVEHARRITAKGLLINNVQLRQKYKNTEEAGSMERRVKEVEMQVLFRLEMESIWPTVIENKDENSKEKDVEEGKKDVFNTSFSEEVTLPDELQETVDEMVTMLQSIPFLTDHGRLTTFLEDVVSNYHDSLAPILKKIYDDLMISKPEQLMSPSQSSQSSVKQPASIEPPSSYGSSEMAKSSSTSQRTRSLVRHPSFDIGSKRQIPVVFKKEAIKKDAIKKEAAKKAKEKKKKKEQEADQTKRVCRNLFTGGGIDGPVRRSPRKKFNPLPRRQSVAVMESATNKRTSPRRRTPSKSPSRLVLKTRVVKETPGKKQVLRAMLRKQERARKQTDVEKGAEIPAVEESPDKIVKETPLPKKHTPQGKGQSKMTRHHSHKNLFYSKKTPRSITVKNLRAKEELSKAISLGARIAGKTPEAKAVSTRLLHNRTQSASAVNLFRNFACPATLMQLRKSPRRKQSEDSPSKNTRSQCIAIPDALPSPKSSKKIQTKSLGKPTKRALWKASDELPKSVDSRKVHKTLEKPNIGEVGVEDTPDKSVKSTWKSPQKCSPDKISKKSPYTKHSPVKTLRKSLYQKYTPEKMPRKSPRKKHSPSKMLTRTSTPVKMSTTLNKTPVKGSAKKLCPSYDTEMNREETHAMSRNKTTSSLPCGFCITGEEHSYCRTQSEMSTGGYSTSSTLEDVFDSPPPAVKSPSNKMCRTPELIKVWKQKKPQSGSSPQTGNLQSPRSVMKSDSPVFGAEATLSGKRPSTSPYACRQRIIRQPAVESNMPSPKFGKHTPSPSRRNSSKSPVSARKQLRTLPVKPLSARKTKRLKNNSSILSWLDIKGIKGTEKEENTLLEVAEYEHKKHEQQMSKSRKRERGVEQEDMGMFKKHKGNQDDDVKVSRNCEQLSGVSTLLDSSVDSDNEIKFLALPINTVDLPKVAGSLIIDDIASVNKMLSPSRKSKIKRSPMTMMTRKRSAECMSNEESLKSPCIDSVKNEGYDKKVQTATNDPNTPSISSIVSQTQTNHKSFQRLPTRRSLAKRMSSGGESSASDQMVKSPMFSEDSLSLSGEDDEDLCLSASQRTLLPAPNDPNKKFTPISKRGLADLLNSPLVSSSERLKKKASDKGTSRRHVSFSSE